MAALKKIDSNQTLWNRTQARRAVYFTAAMFLGRGQYDTRRADTREDLARICSEMGKDAYGRTPMTYAITPEGWSIPLDGLEW